MHDVLFFRRSRSSHKKQEPQPLMLRPLFLFSVFSQCPDLARTVKMVLLDCTERLPAIRTLFVFKHLAQELPPHPECPWLSFWLNSSALDMIIMSHSSVLFQICLPVCNQILSSSTSFSHLQQQVLWYKDALHLVEFEGLNKEIEAQRY